MKRKKALTMALVLVVGIMLVYPTAGFSYDRGHYRPAPRYSSHGGNGLAIAGVALGAIAIGAIIGSVMSQPRETTREVVYTEPAYAQTSGYGPAYGREEPLGQWVMVPGQWVNGQWIPDHQAWVPVNP